MHPTRFVDRFVSVWTAMLVVGVCSRLPADPTAANMRAYTNPSGVLRTYNANGAIDFDNPFFQALGTNGRSCVTCHQPSDGWTIAPAHVQARFEASAGEDAIFRPNDGSNSPYADVSTIDARRTAYSMLLTRGLIRVGIGMPGDAEFDLIEVDDPYGYASAAELSLFRRPLPSTNLAFLATVMWDGRETLAGRSIHFDLSVQANAATLGHAAAASPLTEAQRDEIVAFETGLFTTQSTDNDAGGLNTGGATGGPVALSRQPFWIGINDVLGPAFDPRVFRLFDAWRDAAPTGRAPRSAARAAIARGQDLFNGREFAISGVRGVNDVLGVDPLRGTCTTCHDTPGAGNHSVSLPLDLGVTSAALRTPDMPLYTFRNKATGEIVRTTDPGRALITGRWQHMSTFKGPILRGLAARAPYFHNGIAATLSEVVQFYNTRFNLRLTRQEKADLAAFLGAL